MYAPMASSSAPISEGAPVDAGAPSAGGIAPLSPRRALPRSSPTGFCAPRVDRADRTRSRRARRRRACRRRGERAARRRARDGPAHRPGSDRRRAASEPGPERPTNTEPRGSTRQRIGRSDAGGCTRVGFMLRSSRCGRIGSLFSSTPTDRWCRDESKLDAGLGGARPASAFSEREAAALRRFRRAAEADELHSALAVSTQVSDPGGSVATLLFASRQGFPDSSM